MSVKKAPFILFAWAIAALLSSCVTQPPEASLPPLPAGVTESTLGRWDFIATAGDYALSNCAWNQQLSAPPYAYRAFKGAEGVVPFFGWQWYWNNPAYAVLAYPNASCGSSPWGPMGSVGRTPGYPRKTGNIDLHSSFDVAIETAAVAGKDSWNLSYDIWIIDKDSDPAGFTKTDVKAELMVWVDARVMSIRDWLGSPLDTVTANGAEFDFWFHPEQADGNGPGGKHLYLAFVSRTPIRASADFDLSPYFAYLIDKGYLSTDDYLALVDFGTENIAGSGQVIVKNYSVTLN